MSGEMTPVQLEGHLLELVDLLTSSGLAADFYLVGGAAMSIGFYPGRRLTTDIDAKIASFETIQPFVLDVAERRGLNNDWVNTSAAKLISFVASESDWNLWKQVGAVRVYLASAELLLAMKIAAARPKRDLEDIAVLVEHLGLTRWSQIQYLFEHYFPGDLPTPKAEVLVRVYLGLRD